MAVLGNILKVSLSSAGPGSPNVAHIALSSGRTFGVFVYWIPVQGGDTYVVWISDGENCTATSESFCSIDPVECGESYTVSIVASNNAGSSEPSVPTQFVTCGYSTQHLTDIKYLKHGNQTSAQRWLCCLELANRDKKTKFKADSTIKDQVQRCLNS